MSRMRLIAWSGGSLKNGGSPSTISITMMPRDQISTYNYFNKKLLTKLCSRFIASADKLGIHRVAKQMGSQLQEGNSK